MREAAIVILNYNGEEMLQRFLPSVLLHSTYPIIVADNASTDRSLKVLELNFPSVQILRMNSNAGFAGGYNEALRLLEGQYEFYILLNSDVEVTKQWDIDLIEYLKLNTKTCAVQPKITSALHPGYFDYAGAGGGFLDSLGYPYCRGRIFNTIERDNGQYDDSIRVDWSSGACMAVRSSDYHRANGFDDRFFAHMEEIDLCWRWRSMGKEIHYCGKVEVKHLGGGTLSRSNPKKTYLNFRNSLLMLDNNLRQSELLWKYLIRLVLDIIAAAVFLFQGKPHDAISVLKAHIGFLKLRNKNSNKDVALKLPSRSTNNVASILWLYYIKGKKKFSQL
ncbi:glycosyltransferase family 2 protein [Belliella kenyensis]|uniref:Glycosyltransferase family 2 protein n=1 Tax=Belliella kenyensis TaxID=1472724 RepID=A0ABV8EPT6_9BACT|nr:glycosyltransferase family 2 protein [Belliella kenyensis]MCH7403580.1 glycosyltransferase family 2 protein [Belliella kenyensis]MDN3603868.1 glycosyltransferase family 2 protein [Belliella kenyensis]